MSGWILTEWNISAGGLLDDINLLGENLNSTNTST
jgi:hypothetical protein